MLPEGPVQRVACANEMSPTREREGQKIETALCGVRPADGIDCVSSRNSCKVK